MRACLVVAMVMAAPLTGCREPVAPAADSASRPLFDFSNGPSHPGRSGVFREAGNLAFFVIDPGNGLMSFHGISTTWTALCSGTPPQFDPVDAQFMFTPAGAAAGIFRAAEHSVFVYPEADIGFTAGPEDCPVMVTLPLLAQGSASFIRTDNDFFGSGGPRRNAFGWRVTGVLDDVVNGGTVGYSETVRFIIDQANPPSEITPVSVAIRLHPRPGS